VYQSSRDSPFSLWGWGQYHAEGIPDLGFVQPVVAGLAVAIALLVGLVPREKGPVELAALTAAVLIAFQLSLTHWFYLYLPWMLPFVVLWLALPGGEASCPRSGPGEGVWGNREVSPASEAGYETEMRSDSIAVAMPDSESESITAPSIRTSP
jgi:hypothetical protein